MEGDPSVPDRPAEKLRDVIAGLTPKQFDQLISFLVQELGPESKVEYVPTDSDAPVDMEVAFEHPFVEVTYGVGLKQRSRAGTVSADLVRAFRTDLEDRGLQTSVIITTGDFSEPAQEVADRHSISLLSGERLVTLLLANELGFTRTDDTITLDESFWELFIEPERSQVIPSIEVPQADSIERLDQTLEAVREGNHAKSAIADTVEEASGDTFSSRQADYYGTAGWLLGFLHKDYRPESGGSRARWGITRLGTTYLTHRQTGNEAEAQRILHSQIRQIEIVRRVLQVLQKKEVLTREEVSDIVGEETELAGTTVPRRTRTLIKWLTHLPEIETDGRGSSQRIHHLGDDELEVSTGTYLEANEPKSHPTSEGITDGDDSFEDENILDDIVDSFDLPLTEE